ncbi:MAG: hypothetical protein WBO95_01490 [Candidatus Dechloromonas phosphoritropha]|jgi:hypothetical protein
MDREVRRYRSYFPSWCQTFGDHVPDQCGEGRAVEWLLGERCVGAIAAPEIRNMLIRELFGSRKPRVIVRQGAARLGELEYRDAEVCGHPGYAALLDLLVNAETVHMFLTYHLIYPPGTRIITVSSKGPQTLIYKETAPLRVSVGE